MGLAREGWIKRTWKRLKQIKQRGNDIVILRLKQEYAQNGEIKMFGYNLSVIQQILTLVLKIEIKEITE